MIMTDEQRAISYLEMAASHFAAVADSRAPLQNAVSGLCCLGNASLAFPQIQALATKAAADLHSLLFSSAFVLSEIVAPEITFDELGLALGCANSLLLGGDPELTADRRSTVRILCCRLEMMAERRAMASRGSPLLRAMMINRALAATPQSDTQFQ